MLRHLDIDVLDVRWNALIEISRAGKQFRDENTIILAPDRYLAPHK